MDNSNQEHQQLQLAIRFCDMFNLKDLGLAICLLEEYSWDIDHIISSGIIETQYRPKQFVETRQNKINSEHKNVKSEEKSIEKMNQNKDTEILNKQNSQYEQLFTQMLQKQQKDAQNQRVRAQKEKQYAEEMKFFEKKEPKVPFAIKFRLAHKNTVFTFCRNDSVQIIFKYVSCALREHFESRYASFDLIQSHSPLCLSTRKQSLIKEVFVESEGEVLVVKQLD